jgi:predicted nucleotidyltransferase
VIERLENELEGVKLAEEKKYKEREEQKREIYERVVQFAQEAKKQYGDLIKSVVIFGSAARGIIKPGSDIDVWVILDDTATKSSEDLRNVTTNLYLIAEKLKDLHVQTTALTEFWGWLKIGSPELVNFLRYGLPIYDTGFIKPVQRMLQLGLIPPSEETIKLKAGGAEVKWKRIERDIKSMIFELRYIAIDIIQSVVMYYYKQQPDAKAIPEFLEKLAREKGLEKEYKEKFEELDKLWKDIEHKVVKEVKIEHLKKAQELTKDILERFKKLLPKEIIEELPESLGE